MVTPFVVFLLSSIAVIFAAPSRRAVVNLGTPEIDSFTPMVQFARATYCSGFSDWSCGDACDANSDFQIALAGGDGNAVAHFFVGWSPSLNSIIVAHEGTDPTQLLSDLTDLDFFLTNFNTALFPGVPSNVQGHNGFLSEHAKIAPQILSTVKNLMTSKKTSTITVVGHSLGGALAELDALFLTLNLPSSTVINAYTFGTPRVGNPAYAALLDETVKNFKRINNMKDIIPIVPGRSLGFLHPTGEVHYVTATQVISCPGQDDATDPQCQIQTVPNIFEGNILDHLGPYNGIHIGTIYC